MSQESLPQVQSAYALQRETNDWFINIWYPKEIAESPLGISSILNNFKSFIKQVHQKDRTENITKKKDQKNYFRAEISHKKEQLLRLKVKKKIDL